MMWSSADDTLLAGYATVAPPPDRACLRWHTAASVLAGLPQPAAGRALRQQLIRAQLERADRLRQRQHTQTLAEQRTELLHLGARGGESEPASGRGVLAVHEPAFELRHAAPSFQLSLE